MILWSRSGPRRSAEANAGPIAEREQRFPWQGDGRRGDSGLTTLEWLLIVAAVAGLAALAVVLVQNVVGDTSEQISGNSARATAAKVAAAEINDKARAADLSEADAAETINAKYSKECRQLSILYADSGITSDYEDGTATGTDWNTEPECTVSASAGTAAPPPPAPPPPPPPPDTPGAPTGVRYDAASGTLFWTAPTTGGPVYKFSITCSGHACPLGNPWLQIPSDDTEKDVGTPSSALTGQTALFTIIGVTNDGRPGTSATVTYTV